MSLRHQPSTFIASSTENIFSQRIANESLSVSITVWNLSVWLKTKGACPRSRDPRDQSCHSCWCLAISSSCQWTIFLLVCHSEASLSATAWSLRICTYAIVLLVITHCSACWSWEGWMNKTKSSACRLRLWTKGCLSLLNSSLYTHLNELYQTHLYLRQTEASLFKAKNIASC